MNTDFARTRALATALLLLLVAPAARAQRLFYTGVSLYDHTGVTFTVNGFPLQTVAATQQPLTTTDLTAYLVQGANVIAWKFSGQPEADVPGVFRFRLERKVEGGDTVAEKFTIERFIVRDQEGAAPNIVTFFTERLVVSPVGGFRHELRSRLDPGKASRATIDLAAPVSSVAPLPAEPGETTLSVTIADAPLLTLPWQGAPVVLTPADESEIKGIVTSMRAAFVAQNATALADLQTLRIQRFANARAQTEAEFRQQLIESYAPLFANPAFVFDPIDPAALTLLSHPGVNLVQVLLNGQPPIKATGQVSGQPATFKVPVFVSKIAGAWKIVD